VKPTAIVSTRLKPGMYVQYGNGLKTIRKVVPGRFGVTVVEFSNGDRTAFSTSTTAVVLSPYR
jgi:hypothetical protein